MNERSFHHLTFAPKPKARSLVDIFVPPILERWVFLPPPTVQEPVYVRVTELAQRVQLELELEGRAVTQ